MTKEQIAATLRSAGRQLAQGLLQLVYPATCFACDEFLSAGQVNFCTRCQTALITDPFPCCPRCAVTVGPHVPLDGGCKNCRDRSFHFERVVRLGPYDGLLRDVILRMKRVSGEGLAEMLANLSASHLEDRLGDLKADVAVPVPLHWRRRWKRGYNQSEVLARALADHLHIPCQPGWLRRVRNTPQQTSMASDSARRDNVRNAFAASAWAQLGGKTILLVDDVVTTRSTANDAARALRRAGAGRVVVAVLARAHG